jgi:hypothetical protein
VTGQTLPAVGHAHPHLRHRHPERLDDVVGSRHLVDHLAPEDGGVADHRDLDVGQPL